MWTFTRPGNPSSLPCLVNHANDGTNPAAQQSQRSENHILATSGDSPCPRNQSITGTFDVRHGSLNVPIEHHPTIRYMVYNNYYKVMSNLPKMGHLPTPELANKCQTFFRGCMSIYHQQIPRSTNKYLLNLWFGYWIFVTYLWTYGDVDSWLSISKKWDMDKCAIK